MRRGRVKWLLKTITLEFLKCLIMTNLGLSARLANKIILIHSYGLRFLKFL